MKLNTNSLPGFSLSATDGEVGRIEEVYFDDRNWAIRYLVVKTGSWLSGRKVLISPQAFDRSRWNGETFPVNLTKKQILNSPDVDTEIPLSSKHTASINKYYLWQTFMDDGFYAPAHCDPPDLSEDAEMDNQSDDHFHLRSTRQTKGYHIYATDGEIGYVCDFIVSDEDWKMEYLVVVAKSIFGDQKILISVRDIREIKWASSNIYLDISVKAVEQSRIFDGSTFSDHEIISAYLI
jgi:hypothetical protein